MTIGEDRNKYRLKNWQLCAVCGSVFESSGFVTTDRQSSSRQALQIRVSISCPTFCHS